MQNDDIVSGWRSGANSVDGLENPAGPLYIEGEAATIAAMTTSNANNMITSSLTVVTCRGAACCLCGI